MIMGKVVDIRTASKRRVEAMVNDAVAKIQQIGAAHDCQHERYRLEAHLAGEISFTLNKIYKTLPTDQADKLVREIQSNFVWLASVAREGRGK
jgi:hypothetical protein